MKDTPARRAKKPRPVTASVTPPPRSQKPRAMIAAAPRAPRATADQAHPQPFPVPALAAQLVSALDKAFQRFFREAPTEEVERWQRAADAAQQNGGLSETSLWRESVLLWDAYCENGEAVVLEKLPYLLLWDCAFFLQQWWVVNLIATWHREAHPAKITALLFGTMKHTKGQRGFATVMGDYYRDIRVYRAVENTKWYTGCSENAAYDLVSKGWRSLGMTAGQSPKNVQRIHLRMKKEFATASQDTAASRGLGSPRQPSPNPFAGLFSSPR